MYPIRCFRHWMLFGVLFAAAWNLATSAKDRVLVQDTVIAAPVAEVWAMFTDAEKARQWMAPRTKFDLRVGGDFRTSYDPKSTLEDDTTIVNRVLSFEPERMLSMQNVKSPQGFDHPEIASRTWSVVYFEPLGPRHTRLRCVGMGYGEGPEWDQMYKFFDEGNTYLFDKLKEVLEAPRDTTADQVLTLMRRLSGGDWIHESTRPDGSTFRVRNRIEPGPHPDGLSTRGWLGDDLGMTSHGMGVVYRAPASDRVCFLNIDEHGGIARGEIELQGDDTLHWDWNLEGADGKQSAFDVVMKFTGTDEYQFQLARIESGEKPLKFVDITFHRVRELPEAFGRLKSPPSPSPPAPGADDNEPTER